MTEDERAAAIRRLAERTGTLAEQVALNRAELHEEREWRRRYSRLFIVVSGLVVALLVVLGVVVLQVRSTQQVVRDCTQPGGDCFERGQAAQAGAVQSIVTRLTDEMHRTVCVVVPAAPFCD